MCSAVVFVGISPALGAGNWVASLIVIGAFVMPLSCITFSTSTPSYHNQLVVTGAQTGAPPSKPPSKPVRKIIKSWSWENFFMVWICRAVVFVGISPALLILGAGNWVASLIVIGAIFVLLSGINFDID
jgi:hypothetical protein